MTQQNATGVDAQPEVRASRTDTAERIYLAVYGCDRDEAALFRAQAPSFGITPVMTSAPVSEANIALTGGSRCISIGHKAHVSNALLSALGAAGVRYISTRSIGYNHVDVTFANRLGITVENVSYSPDSVADYTLMLALMLIRQAKSIVRRTDLHDYRLSERRGRELRDLTVGVIGTGRIGGAVIERLRGFGCRIIAHGRTANTSADYVSLDELLRQSDIVSLHVPLDATTHRLLDRPRLERLRPGAFVINTGRGELIDTEALTSLLESGRLGGAALDVLEEEDGVFYTDHGNLPLENKTLARLQKLPNAIITPHTAYFTDHAASDTVVNGLINCAKFERGSTRV